MVIKTKVEKKMDLDYKRKTVQIKAPRYIKT